MTDHPLALAVAATLYAVLFFRLMRWALRS